MSIQTLLSKKHLLNKNSLLSALLALVAILIIVRITPPSVDPIVKLVISKNRTGITNIHQPRDIEATREVMVDRVNLHHKGRFSHPKLGNIADYSDDFFVDINHSIKVTKADSYRFILGSDDGFSISVDGKLLCEFAGDRPYTAQPCITFLSEGIHQIQISYFQGFANSGLTVQYARGNEKPRWFGDDSDNVKF